MLIPRQKKQKCIHPPNKVHSFSNKACCAPPFRNSTDWFISHTCSLPGQKYNPWESCHTHLPNLTATWAHISETSILVAFLPRSLSITISLSHLTASLNLKLLEMISRPALSQKGAANFVQGADAEGIYEKQSSSWLSAVSGCWKAVLLRLKNDSKWIANNSSSEAIFTAE